MELTLNWNLLNRWKLAVCLDLIRVSERHDEMDPLQDPDLRHLLTSRDQHLLKDIGLDRDDRALQQHLHADTRRRLDPLGLPWW